MDENPYAPPEVPSDRATPNNRWVRHFCDRLSVLVGWVVGIGTVIVVIWMLYQVLRGEPTR